MGISLVHCWRRHRKSHHLLVQLPLEHFEIREKLEIVEEDPAVVVQQTSSFVACKGSVQSAVVELEEQEEVVLVEQGVHCSCILQTFETCLMKAQETQNSIHYLQLAEQELVAVVLELAEQEALVAVRKENQKMDFDPWVLLEEKPFQIPASVAVAAEAVPSVAAVA